MDFQKAVHWHFTWLQNLLVDIQNPSKLNPKAIARDDVCEIGKWIEGAATQYSELPEYQALKQVHLEIHEAAADAVILAQSGKLKEAKQYLSVDGDCVHATQHLLDRCQQLIKKMA